MASAQPSLPVPAAALETEVDLSDSDGMESSVSHAIPRDDLINPYWMEDPDLKKGKEGKISSDEAQFWKDMMAKVCLNWGLNMFVSFP